MITCPNCQHQMPDGALYCEECGQNIWDVRPDPVTRVMKTGTANKVAERTEFGTQTFRMGQPLTIQIPDIGDPFTIQIKKEYVIGRSDINATVQPDLDLTSYDGLDKGVSRIHAALHVDEDTLTLVDLASTNGTILNGHKLTAHEPHVVRDGDEIKLGTLVMNIYFEPV